LDCFQDRSVSVQGLLQLQQIPLKAFLNSCETILAAVSLRGDALSGVNHVIGRPLCPSSEFCDLLGVTLPLLMQFAFESFPQLVLLQLPLYYLCRPFSVSHHWLLRRLKRDHSPRLLLSDRVVKLERLLGPLSDVVEETLVFALQAKQPLGLQLIAGSHIV